MSTRRNPIQSRNVWHINTYITYSYFLMYTSQVPWPSGTHSTFRLFTRPRTAKSDTPVATCKGNLNIMHHKQRATALFPHTGSTHTSTSHSSSLNGRERKPLIKSFASSRAWIISRKLPQPFLVFQVSNDSWTESTDWWELVVDYVDYGHS